MKKITRKLSFILALFFMFAIFPVRSYNANVQGVDLPKADMMTVLVGDFVKDQGLGNDWDPKNIGTLMKEYAKGIYMLTVNFKSTKKYSYKVAFNGQWDNPKALGDNGNNKTLNVTQKGPVTFLVDTIKQAAYDSINDPKQFKTSATVTGSFGTQDGAEWWKPDLSKYDLAYEGNDFYRGSFELPKGNYSYKVAYNHVWGNGEVDSNVSFKLDKQTTVTFLANPYLGLCTDSINDPSINDAVSLIGDIRGTEGGKDDWNQSLKGYEFSDFTSDGKKIYSNFYKEGTYQYKGVENYNWDSGGIPSSGNKKIVVPKGGKYVVFVCDAANKAIYDSINDADKVAEVLGLQSLPVTAKSPVINANGSITFNYQDAKAKSVYLAGTMTDWQNGKIPMVKTDTKNNIWSYTVRLGDKAYNGSYKFIVDGNWITDPCNNSNLDKDGNSVLNVPAYKGRKVVVAGTVQAAAGEANWTPSSDRTRMNYDGNGNYSLTIKNMPQGDYEYKIAMGSWDPENYGAGGKFYGDNIKMSVPKTEDVTFWYNDDSHMVVDSTSYVKADISLKGTGIPDGTKLTDTSLTGIYTAKVTLNKGQYTDIKAVYNGKEYPYSEIDINESSKEVTFSFDPNSEMTFSDAADKKIDVNTLYYDSQDQNYKSPFGAAPTDSKITFNLKTGTDITEAKLILITSDGTKKLQMTSSGNFADDTSSKKWTVSYTPSAIGVNSYYFVVSNGSDVKAYGDDDGYMGSGTGGNIGSVQYYNLNVYDKNFKTPDWMKNAVVYQIFPDRFFDGDTSNDHAQTTSRGSTNYEFPSDWYKVPEDPALEYKTDSSGAILYDKDGKPIPNPDFKGKTRGDGIWNNEIYGGDLKGISEKLDYLKALGVNTLYLNPISQSISSHRYDTTDYTHVDPLLGHDEDFAELTRQAKKRGMHIILDGVFNHVCDDSVYFDRYGKYMAKSKPLGAYQYWSRVYDIMNTKGVTQQEAEKQVTNYFASIGITDLHYKDWFKVYNKKVPASANDPEHYDYLDWSGYDSLVTIQHLDGSEYNIKSWDDEIIDGPNSNSRKWLRNGASGWRLDVANEIADDVWPHFRKAVKEEGDNVIIGEIWTDASKYLLGDKFDSVMNYRFRDAVLAFVDNDSSNPVDAVKAMKELELIREEYPKEAFEAMLNLVDSHDTQRVISALDGYKKSVHDIASNPSKEAYAKDKLIPLIQMTYPGAPCIYYGDEAGMAGADDPDNRRGMIWGKGDKATVEWYAKLANIRNSYPVLRTGDIKPITLDDSCKSDVMAFSRNDGSSHALVLINRKTSDISGLKVDAESIPDGTVLKNALNPDESYTVSGGKVTVNVPAQSGVILVSNYNEVKVNYDGLKDAYDPSYIVSSKVLVSGITLDKNNVSLKVGDKVTLNASVTPQNAALKTVKWISSNPEIASVDADGNVTGVSEGNVVIKAVTVDGNYTASCAVNVTAVQNENQNQNQNLNPNQNENGSGNSRSAVSKGKLPKTGSFIDTKLLVGLGILFIIGGALLIFRKKSESDKDE